MHIAKLTFDQLLHASSSLLFGSGTTRFPARAASLPADQACGQASPENALDCVDAFSPISGLPEIGAYGSAQVGQGRLGAANRKSTPDQVRGRLSPENAMV